MGRWDVMYSWELGEMVGDIPGNPIPMCHQDGMDSWGLGGMVGDIPGNPVPSRWVIGMGWTVGIWVGWLGDIPGNPVPSQLVIGMGWTVGSWVGWLGTSQVIPSHPDGSLGCDGQLGSGWDGWGHPR